MQLRAQRSFIVTLLILANIPIYVMWQVLPETYMLNHFSVSFASLAEGRIWTLISSVFSHEMFLHLFINMFVLNSFGRLLERLMGHLLFLKFYLIAGVVASFAHAFASYFILGEFNQPAVGASGAIAGLILLFALIFPKERILIFGLIPIPAIFGALLFIGLDAWGLIAQSKGGGLPIGHGAHLGGAFTGIIYFFYLRHKARSQNHRN